MAANPTGISGAPAPDWPRLDPWTLGRGNPSGISRKNPLGFLGRSRPSDWPPPGAPGSRGNPPPGTGPRPRPRPRPPPPSPPLRPHVPRSAAAGPLLPSRSQPGDRAGQARPTLTTPRTRRGGRQLRLPPLRRSTPPLPPPVNGAPPLLLPSSRALPRAGEMPRPTDRAPLPPAPAGGAGPAPVLPPPPASLPACMRPLYILPAAALLCAEHGSYYTGAALGRYLTEQHAVKGPAKREILAWADVTWSALLPAGRPPAGPTGRPRDGDPPIDGLPVYTGYRCGYRGGGRDGGGGSGSSGGDGGGGEGRGGEEEPAPGCRFLTISLASLQQHRFKAHGLRKPRSRRR
ncbi:hypothetical protein EJ08DRAFT_654892 [Tothia fuscella]|uniref:Uncharacterized protein n=1 Tax=Tothia fuscella TaxID=1048955 RepID=A0A9P4P1V2_9PEZI|nr:hypothetical protein EJ08DRAFT_654892 [Tothia fuscella]